MATNASLTSASSSGIPALRSRLLALPIFYKVLIANTLIVVLGAVAGSSLTLSVSDYISVTGKIELIAFFACLGTLLSVSVNFIVLKAAFSPLVELERTVDEVRTGNMTARASRSPYADPHIEKLTDTVNEMLDSIDRYRTRLRALSGEVLQAQEEERKRVARELHDSTGQMLTGLLLRLKSLESSSDPEVRKTAEDLLEIAAGTLDEVRRTAVELRPPALDDLGLVAALRGYIGGFEATTGIQATFCAENIGRLPSNVELVLYRVIQEALTNAAKHAHASLVSVTLRTDATSVEARIDDNGRGFDVPAVLRSRKRGLGLFGMRERVGLTGGSLDISCRDGAHIVVRIPLSPSLERLSA